MLIGILLTTSGMLAAADTASAAKTILERSCLKCHGPDKQKGGLRLDSHAAVLKGGKEGVVVVAGDPAKQPADRGDRLGGRGHPHAAQAEALG